MDTSNFNPNVELHKLEEDGRKRVFRACISCRKSRRKCNGETPCNMCSHRNEVCEYDAPKKRGPPPKAKGDGSGHTGHDDDRVVERSIAPSSSDLARAASQASQAKKRVRGEQGAGGAQGGRPGGKGAKGAGSASMMSDQGSGMFISGMMLPSSAAGSLFHPSAASVVLQGLGRGGSASMVERPTPFPASSSSSSSAHGHGRGGLSLPAGTEAMQAAGSIALGIPPSTSSVMQQAAWLGFGGGGGSVAAPLTGQAGASAAHGLPAGLTRQGSELTTLTGLLGASQSMLSYPAVSTQPSYPLPYGTPLAAMGGQGHAGGRPAPAVSMPMGPVLRHKANGTVYDGSASVALLGHNQGQGQEQGPAHDAGDAGGVGLRAPAMHNTIPLVGRQGILPQQVSSEPPPPHLLPPEGPQEPSPVGASLHASIYEPEHALIVPTVEERMYCKQYLMYQQRAFLPLVDETAFLGDLALVLQCAASAREGEKRAAAQAGRHPRWPDADRQAAQAATAVLGVDRLLALRALFHAVVAFGAAVVGRKGRAVEYFRAARVYALPCTRKPNVHTVSLLYILAFLMKGWEGHSDAGLGSSPGLGFSAAMLSLSEDAVYRALGGYLALSGAVPDLPHNLRLTALLMEYARMHKEAVMKAMHETCPLPGSTAVQPSAAPLPFIGLPNPVQSLLPYPARDPGPEKEGSFDPVLRLAKIYTYLLSQMRDDFSAARDAAGAKVIDSLHDEASALSSRLKAWAPSPLPMQRLMVKVYLHTRAGLPGLKEADLTAVCYGYKYAANCDTSKSSFGVFVLTAKLVNLLLAGSQHVELKSSSPPPWSPVGYARLRPEDPLRVLPYAAHFLYEAQHSGLCPTQGCGREAGVVAGPPNLLATAGVEGVVEREGAGRSAPVQPHPTEATDEHVTALCMLSSDPKACVSNVKSAMAGGHAQASLGPGSARSKGAVGSVPAGKAVGAGQAGSFHGKPNMFAAAGAAAACPGHTKAMDAIKKAVQDIGAYGLATVVHDLPPLPAQPPPAVAAAMRLNQCPKSAGKYIGAMGEDEGDRDSVAVGEEEEARAHPGSLGVHGVPAALPKRSNSLISGEQVVGGRGGRKAGGSKAGAGGSGGSGQGETAGRRYTGSRSTAPATGGAGEEGGSSHGLASGRSAGNTPSMTGPSTVDPLPAPFMAGQMSMAGGAVVANSVLDYQFGSPSFGGAGPDSSSGLPPPPMSLSFQDVHGFLELPLPSA